MKSDAIMKAIALIEGRGKAADALNSIPDGGRPDGVPVEPDTGAVGPPEALPPVDAGPPQGLPSAASENSPDTFPSMVDFPLEEADFGQAPEILDYLFI